MENKQLPMQQTSVAYDTNVIQGKSKIMHKVFINGKQAVAHAADLSRLWHQCYPREE